MAERTPRFDLSVVGGEYGGSLADDGGKYTSTDRLMIDSLLSQVEQHDHHYRPSVTAVGPGAPEVALAAGAGSLEAGRTFYYSYAMLDAGGLEGELSEEASISTPDLLAAPGELASAMRDDQPIPVGTLPPGNYTYMLTALRGAEESIPGPELDIYIGETQGILLALPGFGEADAMRVWRMADGDPGFTKVALVHPGDVTFEDTGAVPADPCSCDPENLPPTRNVGIDEYGITVSLPSGVDPGYGWRLYRTDTSGFYDAASLVEEVISLVDEGNPSSPVMSSWLDVGDPLIVGTPLPTRSRMRVKPFVFDSGPDLPAVAGYPEGYPYVSGDKLYVVVGGVWTAVGKGGGDSEPETGSGESMSSILTSPNGTRFILGVDDSGALVTTQTELPGPPAPVRNVTVL